MITELELERVIRRLVREVFGNLVPLEWAVTQALRIFREEGLVRVSRAA